MFEVHLIVKYFLKLASAREISPNSQAQGLIQDLGTGCPNLAIFKFLGVQIFKGDHNILRFQP